MVIASTIAVFIGTFSGYGISIALVPILTLVLPLPETLFYSSIIYLAHMLHKVSQLREHAQLNLVIQFGLLASVFSLIGALLISLMPTRGLERLLGLYVLAYIGFMLFDPKFRITNTTNVTLVGAISSGFLSGFFGFARAVQSLVLSTYVLTEYDLFATSTLVTLMITFARMTGYFIGGIRLSSTLLLAMIFSIPLSFVAEVVAKRSSSGFSTRNVRIVIGVIFFLLGLRLSFF